MIITNGVAVTGNGENTNDAAERWFGSHDAAALIESAPQPIRRTCGICCLQNCQPAWSELVRREYSKYDREPGTGGELPPHSKVRGWRRAVSYDPLVWVEGETVHQITEDRMLVCEPCMDRLCAVPEPVYRQRFA